MSSTNDSKPSRSEILLAFFESEIYPSIQQAVSGVTNGMVFKGLGKVLIGAHA